MPDVSLIDISEGVRQSWTAAGTSVTNVIPVTKLYFQRAGEGAALPYCVYEFKDVSAYFGGTEYFSGSQYVRVTQITFKVYCTRATDIQAFASSLNDALSWSSTDPNGVWTIPNAVAILSAMPEVEALELEEERVAGEDVIRYETTFSVRMQADRG
jgi:hypothetical protein